MADDRVSIIIDVQNSEAAKKALGDLGIKFTEVGDNAKGAGTQTDSFTKAIKQLVVGLGALQILRSVSGFLKDAVNQASEAEWTFKKLSFAVEKSGLSWTDSKDRIDEFLKKIKETTAYQDEEAAEVLQKLLLHTNDLSQAFIGSKLAMDIASRGLYDLSGATRIVGMALAGNIEALSRFMPEAFKASMNEELKLLSITEKTAYAFKELQDAVGGASEKELDTFQGVTKQCANALDDLKKAIGKMIIEDKVLQEDIKTTTEGINKLAEAGKEGKSIYSFFKELSLWFTLPTVQLQKLIDKYKETQQEVIELEKIVVTGEEEKANAMSSGQFWIQRGIDLSNEITEIETSNYKTAIDAANEAARARVEAARAPLYAIVSARKEELEKLKNLNAAYRDAETGKELETLNNQIAQNKLALDIQLDAHRSYWTMLTEMKDTFVSGMSDAIFSMIEGTKTFGEAMKELGISLLKVLIDFIVQKTINSALESLFLAKQVKEGVIAAKILEVAWRPVAIFRSLASAGTNAIGASIGMVATAGVAKSIGMATAATGMDYVPQDMPVYVHKGERIQRANENPYNPTSTKSGSNMSISNTFNISAVIRENADINKIVEKIGLVFERQMIQARTVS